MVNVAVVLSGCGHKDGSEIREAVITLLALDRAGAKVQIFAPAINQHHVVNHLTGDTSYTETRNVLVESARIARGDIQELSKAKVEDFDALVLPGGFGAAINLSNVALTTDPAQVTVIPELKALIMDFLTIRKPIGAICISPAVLVAAVREAAKPTVTVGDNAELITNLGGHHIVCDTDAMCYDAAHHIASCSAYMRQDTISHVAEGIEKVIEKVLAVATERKGK